MVQLVVHVGCELILKEITTLYSIYFNETSDWGFPPHCQCIIPMKHCSCMGVWCDWITDFKICKNLETILILFLMRAILVLISEPWGECGVQSSWPIQSLVSQLQFPISTNLIVVSVVCIMKTFYTQLIWHCNLVDLSQWTVANLRLCDRHITPI